LAKRHDVPIGEGPIVAGAALVICGILLMQLDPKLLAMPQPRKARETWLARFRRGDRLGAAAQRARDALVEILPANLTGSIGRALVVAGAGVMLVRLLDQLADGRRRR
jgi:hypothetical protein